MSVYTTFTNVPFSGRRKRSAFFAASGLASDPTLSGLAGDPSHSTRSSPTDWGVAELLFNRLY